MKPQDLRIEDFYYELPNEKIAKYPLAVRDASKLLVYKDGKIDTCTFNEIDAQLPTNTLLIFNNTKVVEARLLFEKNTGSTIELFCLEPDQQYTDITTAMLQKGKVFWRCLVGGAKKWKEKSLSKIIEYAEKQIQLNATIIQKRDDYFLIEFNWNNNFSFAEVLHAAGEIPLPPYLNRSAEVVDIETYQTIYAKHDGSVAAPTAGLHFTENVFAKLKQKNIQQAFVTLHVGAGTFKPVKAETLDGHEMHAEFIDVPIHFIKQLIHSLQKQQTIIPVGTTSLRTIESLYWMGVKISEQIKVKSEKLGIEVISIQQWDVYELPQTISAVKALEILFMWMTENNMQRLITKTQIIIVPGYTLKITDGIITNFHQPKSTLLLLISAIIGNDWKLVYEYALANNFRFLSYGDSSLLWKQQA